MHIIVLLVEQQLLVGTHIPSFRLLTHLIILLLVSIFSQESLCVVLAVRMVCLLSTKYAPTNCEIRILLLCIVSFT